MMWFPGSPEFKGIKTCRLSHGLLLACFQVALNSKGLRQIVFDGVESDVPFQLALNSKGLRRRILQHAVCRLAFQLALI